MTVEWRRRGPIALLTDFGTADAYVAAMKGVLLRINPSVTLVDVSHSIPPQNVEEGAFLLEQVAPYFPPGAIYLVVVDPGVGSARRPIAVATPTGIFVGPDNGVLTPALRLPERKVYHLTQPRFWLPTPSPTFHGRDVFAPVAAHLSLGVAIEELGEEIPDPVVLSASRPTRGPDGRISGHVTHIDRFGNAITDIDTVSVPELADRPVGLSVGVGGHVIKRVSQVYAAEETGTLLALVGGSGRLEIAVRDGSAAEALGIRRGDTVEVWRER